MRSRSISNSAHAWFAKAKIFLETNQIDNALEDFDKALALQPDYATCISNKIFALCFSDTGGFAEQQNAQREWWTQIGAPIAARFPPRHSNTREPDRRIRLGYVSADFRTHSAGLSFKQVVCTHDKSQFDVTCYSAAFAEDHVTAEFRHTADRWRNIVQMSDDQLCKQIDDDQIDILIDLSGHSKGHRLSAFARKPAPIQVSGWGYATGTGLKTIDYLFQDPVTCPPAVRHLFAEKIFDLPCVISIQALPGDVPIFPPPVTRNGYVTFGVFNRVTKISDEATALWSRILHEVPSARLLLKHLAFDEASVRRRIADRFAEHGIAADRMTFMGGTSRADHLAAFKDVDISLDPFPQNGGISTWESLQVGVPVIAKLGNTVASRASGAIACAIGLSDWVANSADEYLEKAVKFAAMPGHLEMLRTKLPAMIEESGAGNSVKYTKAVEAAYRKMWIDYCASPDKRA